MRVIDNYAYYRLFGYTATIALHIGNSIAMLLTLQGDVMKDPEIKTFYSLQWMYITIWNVLFQILYSGLGILCDLPTLLEIKENTLTKYLKSYREIVFSSVIVPASLIIVIMYWPLYLYDRELIFPGFIDKVLSQKSNHIMHTAILPIIIWEFIFLPKFEPKSHHCNAVHIIGCFISYLLVLLSTYARRGVWPYLILKLCYGTIYFPLIFFIIGVVLFLIYIGYWRLNALLWESNVKQPKKNLNVIN